jgi:hypothetical protein
MKKNILLLILAFSFNSFAQPITVWVDSYTVYCPTRGADIFVNVQGGVAPYEFSYDSGVTYQSSNYAFVPEGTYGINVRDAIGQLSALNFVIVEVPEYTQMSLSVEIENQTATCFVSGGRPTYAFSRSDLVTQISNVFTNLPLGENTIYVFDSAGCNKTIQFFITAISQPVTTNNIPSGTIQNFTPGQTLADAEALFNLTNGATIKWYTAANSVSNRGSFKSASSELPSSTVMVEGASYFAAKVESGLESTARYELKVTLQPLNSQSFTFDNLSTFPNPIVNSLTINNDTTIDSFQISTTSGQILMDKTIKNTSAEIDVSSLKSGIYFMKLESGGAKKVLKILKN